MKYDAIVVGGGVAGLTAAAYLSKAGYSTLVCEKQDHFGGLVNTFERDGFNFDGGIRATEDSGILLPMLKQLGIELDFVPNKITLGIEDRIIQIRSEADVDTYQDMLNAFYPENVADIAAIMAQVRRVIKLMEVQYGIKNPAFLDMQADRDYMMKEIVPWMFKYLFTFRKIEKLNTPVEEFLQQFTDNASLLDIITQHFFKATPAFFALGYLKLYLEYLYPLGGTGKLIESLTDFITAHGGTLQANTAITALDPAAKTVTDSAGQTLEYDTLIWAADLKALYNNLKLDNLPDAKVKQAIFDRKEEIADKKGNDSILTLFLAADLEPTYFADIASEHFFYTPSRTGESSAGPFPIGQDKDAVWKWLAKFFTLTTYEIAIPALRDPAMAPEGQTGLVISMLFDYGLVKYIRDSGWYEEFKTYAEDQILQTLTAHVYPGLSEKVLFRFTSTPLTIESISGNTEGAITGWAFTNDPIPAEDGLPKIFSASATPIPDVFQAGQWTYSPSGLPISILTGKLSADRAIKALGKRK